MGHGPERGPSLQAMALTSLEDHLASRRVLKKAGDQDDGVLRVRE